MHVLCKTVFGDEAKTHQKRQNLNPMDKRTDFFIIARSSSRNGTLETLISRRLGLLTRNWPRRTSHCLCPLQQGRLYSLSLALRLSWSVCYSERQKKSRDSALNTTSSHNLRRGRTHPPLHCETPHASDERIQLQPCGITQFTPHLQHLPVPCCLAVGHNVPAVAVGDETAICSQESHFALRQNIENRGGSRLEAQPPVINMKRPRSWCNRVSMWSRKPPKTIIGSHASDESW